jgi:hypothetical protein
VTQQPQVRQRITTTRSALRLHNKYKRSWCRVFLHLTASPWLASSLVYIRVACFRIERESIACNVISRFVQNKDAKTNSSVKMGRRAFVGTVTHYLRKDWDARKVGIGSVVACRPSGLRRNTVLEGAWSARRRTPETLSGTFAKFIADLFQNQCSVPLIQRQTHHSNQCLKPSLLPF